MFEDIVICFAFFGIAMVMCGITTIGMWAQDKLRMHTARQADRPISSNVIRFEDIACSLAHHREGDKPAVREPEIVCERCGYAVDEDEIMDIDGQKICMDCFYELCKDEDVKREYLPGFIEEHKDAYLRWWYEGLDDVSQRYILQDGYKNYLQWMIRMGRQDELEEMEYDFATSDCSWEDYLRKELRSL